MDLKQIKELMKEVENSKIHRLRVKDKEGVEIEIEKAPPPPAHQHVAPMPQAHHQTVHPTEAAPKEKEKGHILTSPMVGIFYAAPSPEEPFFVKVGDQVDEDTVLCIIEAMKVMNEVKAGRKGVIAEVYADNGHPIEFGTKLFRIQ